jgi:hypothetical protein
MRRDVARTRVQGTPHFRVLGATRVCLDGWSLVQ